MWAEIELYIVLVKYMLPRIATIIDLSSLILKDLQTDSKK